LWVYNKLRWPYDPAAHIKRQEYGENISQSGL
jgi:hypothetical protein